MSSPKAPAYLLSFVLVFGLAVCLEALPEQETVGFEVTQLLTEDGTLILIQGRMANGQIGTWRLALETEPDPGVIEGTRGRLTAGAETLRTSGPATVGFKGSDEELQAVVELLSD